MPLRYKIKLLIIELDKQSFHLVVRGKINDIPVNMVIDTGASRSVFSREYLEEFLDISDAGGEAVYSAGLSAERIETVMAAASSFKLGRLELTDYPLILINLRKISKLYNKVTGMNIHGLLGSDFLMDMNAIIDYGKSVLILKPEEHAKIP